jgi:hypothetical protein
VNAGVCHRASFGAAAAFVVLLAPATARAWTAGGAEAGWSTNSVQLDPGMCGRMLQTGSDPTATNTSTPTFLLAGDGGLSSYSVSIDGKPIGTFSSDGHAVVCIRVTAPLSDGGHVLTAAELAPQPTLAVAPFAFTVDTVPPRAPSAPSLSAYTDSGIVGDGVTSFTQVNLTGTADPGARVQVLDGVSGIAGATADASGHWSATTRKLADGSYSITAATFDEAGNESARSKAMPLTIDDVAPATPATPKLLALGGDGSAVVGGSAATDVATILVFLDGAQAGTATPDSSGAWSFTSASLAPGSHIVAVAAADVAGNLAPQSAPLTLTIAQPQQAAAPPPSPAPTPAPAPAPNPAPASPPPSNPDPVPVSAAPVPPPPPDPGPTATDGVSGRAPPNPTPPDTPRPPPPTRG